jgi:DNA polymerase-4
MVPADNRKYTHTSSQIMRMFHDYTPLVEVFSIDEAWLDVTGSLSLFGGAESIAYKLKSRIKYHFDITCSIGIAPNKLLAKLASEMKKPDGLTVIRPEEVSRVLEHMPIKELCGIGRNMVSAMDAVNDRFDFTVTYGSLLGNNGEKGSHVISPAWKPVGIRNVQVA